MLVFQEFIKSNARRMARDEPAAIYANGLRAALADDHYNARFAEIYQNLVVLRDLNPRADIKPITADDLNFINGLLDKITGPHEQRLEPPGLKRAAYRLSGDELNRLFEIYQTYLPGLVEKNQNGFNADLSPRMNRFIDKSMNIGPEEASEGKFRGDGMPRVWGNPEAYWDVVYAEITKKLVDLKVEYSDHKFLAQCQKQLYHQGEVYYYGNALTRPVPSLDKETMERLEDIIPTLKGMRLKFGLSE